jgi:hypothetical protein
LQNPFGYPCGMFFLSDDLLDDILAAKSEKKRERIFLSYLGDIAVSSPYELYGLVWYRHEDCPIDVQALTLDYIVSAKSDWDPDHVACFLLEVAEDLSRFVDISSWLIEVDLPEMVELEYAGIMVWEMFWQGHAQMIGDLINHYQWNSVFARELDAHLRTIDPNEDPGDYCFYYALARMFEAGEFVDPDEPSSLADGLQAQREEDFKAAIDNLLEFHKQFPNVVPQKIRITLADCYLATGWRSLAHEWLKQAREYDPEDPTIIKLLIKQTVSSDVERLQRIQKELVDEFGNLTPESLEVLTQAEFLYRWHGEMAYDYANVVSGYARAVEIQLRQSLLPRLREWIKAYGVEKEGKRLIRAGGKPLCEDFRVNHVSLGTWSSFFDKKRPQDCRLTPGEFYHCVYETYGEGADFDRLAQFGKLLSELTKLRNPAAHGIVNDWSKAHRARELLFEENLLNITINIDSLFTGL